MKTILTTILLSAAFLLTTACMTDYRTPQGGLVTIVKMHKDIPSKTGAGTKTGTACASNVLMTVATGDASLATAAANGGITKIHSVDYEKLSIYYFYFRLCTIVHGT